MVQVHELDVAIVGGGPAGCALALALDPGLSVVVIDPGEGPSAGGVGETLTPGARSLLERLGVWSAFLAQQHLPAYGTAACWGSAQVEDHPFLFHPVGCGWQLDRARFDGLLRERVPLVVGRASLGAKRSLVVGELELRPRMVVDASGRAMTIARARGAERVAWDRGVARFARHSGADSSGDTTTLIEAVRDGWWYSARVPGGDLIAASISDPEQPASLGPETARRLAGTTAIGRWQCSARAQAATRVHGEDWLAVGDAALAADPLSSQGIVQALAMGIAAADAIRLNFAGDTSALARYAESIAGLRRQFLGMRRDTYRRELRFADAPFWRSRQQQVTLAPTARLQHVQPLGPGHMLHLPRRELALLAETCGAGRLAHEVVREFQRIHPRTDMVVLLALQGLHDAGVVHSA